MTKGLEVIPFLSTQAFEAHEFGVNITGHPAFELCYEFLSGMARIEKATPWIIGDTLNWAEEEYGEEWTQLLAIWPQYKNETIKVYKWVCLKVKPVIRITSGLSFSHHVVIAAKEPNEQERLLKLATNKDPDKQWTVSKLRRHIQEEKEEIQERLYSLRLTRPEIDSLEYVLTQLIENESEQVDADILSIRGKARELLST